MGMMGIGNDGLRALSVLFRMRIPQEHHNP